MRGLMVRRRDDAVVSACGDRHDSLSLPSTPLQVAPSAASTSATAIIDRARKIPMKAVRVILERIVMLHAHAHANAESECGVAN